MFLHPVDEADEAPGEHEGFVAGRRANGGLTTVPEARTHSDGRYVAYVPRCRCGWTGPAFSTTATGFAACLRLWRDKHLEPFLRARGRQQEDTSASWTPLLIHGALATEH